jgi:hypothetical protein
LNGEEALSTAYPLAAVGLAGSLLEIVLNKIRSID